MSDARGDRRDDGRAQRPGLAPTDIAATGGDPQVGKRSLRRERARPQDETSLRGGILGIAAVTLATAVISVVGALIALVVALLF
jgi:hypothetical protein